MSLVFSSSASVLLFNLASDVYFNDNDCHCLKCLLLLPSLHALFSPRMSSSWSRNPIPSFIPLDSFNVYFKVSEKLYHFILECCSLTLKSHQCFAFSLEPAHSWSSLCVILLQEILLLPSIHTSSRGQQMGCSGPLTRWSLYWVLTLPRQGDCALNSAPSRLANPDYSSMFPVLEAAWMTCGIFDPLTFIFSMLTLGKLVHFLGINTTANVSTSAHYFSGVPSWQAGSIP